MSLSKGPWRWSESGPPCLKTVDGDKLILGLNVFTQPNAADAAAIAAVPEMVELLREPLRDGKLVIKDPANNREIVVGCDWADRVTALLARIQGKP